MTNGDAERFAGALAFLAETWGTVLSEARVEAYFEALRDLDVGVVEEAMAAARRECKFFPVPAELRTLAGARGPDAGEAYQALVAVLRAHGTARRVPALPPLLATLVERLGGWQRALEMPDRERWLRWREMYEPVRQAAAVRGDAAVSLEAPRAVPALEGPR